MDNQKTLDIKLCREKRNYKFKEYLGRFLWSFINPLFKLSPRNFFAWRNFLLRLFGAKLGSNVHIYPSVSIFIPWNLSVGDYSSIGDWALIYNLGEVYLGDSVTISHKSHICSATHIYTKKDLPLQRKKIVIENYAWVCAEAFISPGITIGEGAVVGARSVVLSNVNKWEVVGGNPAKFIKKRVIEYES